VCRRHCPAKFLVYLPGRVLPGDTLPENNLLDIMRKKCSNKIANLHIIALYLVQVWSLSPLQQQIQINFRMGINIYEEVLD
jgi:hypothetical protein